jgi:DNA-binding transcriptional MerR regulator
VNDYLSIKEFSKLTGVKPSTLRYYDELGIFSPVHRADNGYRYYSARQVITINSIKLLQEIDVPTRVITKLINNRSEESIIEVLGIKQQELGAELERLQAIKNVIDQRYKMISIGYAADASKIEVREVEEFHYRLGPKNDFGTSTYFLNPFMRFCAEAPEYGIDLRFPVAGIFDDMDTWVLNPTQPSHWFSVDPTGDLARPAGDYVVGYSRGYYGEVGDLPERVSAYIRKKKLNVTGPVYNIFLLDELSVKDTNQYLLQISILVN